MVKTILTLKDIVDVLTEFDVIHVDDLSPYGVCSFEARRICLANDMRLNTKRRTIIHEAYHALAYLNNLKDTEKAAKEIERRTFNRYYGKR